MLQLDNLTPFAANITLFPNEQGVDTLYLLVKASFHISGKLTLLEEQSPPVEADIYYGEPEASSLKYASDYHTGKPSTDLIMNGMACSPGGKSVQQLDVSLNVGSLGKTIRVFGNRQWMNGKATKPEPFSTMPMIYENAFGGVHVVDGEIDSADKRNPVGKGYPGSCSTEEMNGMSLPNLEAPEELIRTPTDFPTPACFGFIAPGWQPRVNHVGTYDDSWQTQRAPYLPLDFDRRFFNMAHPDVVAADYLTGGEPVLITGMHPAGDLRFNLPNISMQSSVVVGGESYQPILNLETVMFEPNKLQMSMTWRAAFPCDKKILKIEKVKVSLRR